MSTSVTSEEASSAPKSSTLLPIEILRSQYASLYANLQPILLLSVFILNFHRLVDDPVPTLLGLAPTVALIQAVYCVICLPTTGQSAPPNLKASSKKKSAKASPDFGAKLVPAFLSFILTLSLSAPALFITVVLFGAPLTTHHAHTLLLALHLALLTTPHLFYAHGLESASWRRIASLQLPVDELYGMSLGACVGAWLGAIPIPLDWDREWQKWPVTVVAGCYLGAVVGKLLGGYVFKGFKMKLA